MIEDFAYEYFLRAFFDWTKSLGEGGKAVQKEISDILGVNKSTAHRYIKGSRKIPFERQVKIANAAGYDYITFLQRGKELFEAGRPQKMTHFDEVTEDHISFIPDFTHKEDAIEINQDLLKIDKRAPRKLESIKTFIKGVLAGLPEENNKTGTGEA